MVLRGGAGIAMEPDDAESLLRCIGEIRKRGRDAFDGRGYVLEHFHRDRLAERMLDMLVRASRA